MSGNLVQYVIVRKDLLKALKWPTGALLAQACHACTAVMHLFYNDPSTQQYLDDLDRMHKVVLEVKFAVGFFSESNWTTAFLKLSRLKYNDQIMANVLFSNSTHCMLLCYSIVVLESHFTASVLQNVIFTIFFGMKAKSWDSSL